MNIKPELVLPGGDLKRAKIALNFGADAIYVGLNKYSLRKGEVRFNIAEINKVIEYAHSLKKKCYVTFNIFAHEEHLKDLELDIKKIADFHPDAFIVADIGIIQIVKKVASKVPIHVSTQANVTNSEQVRFYQNLGAKRVVLARELNLKEIKKIHHKFPEIELEVFVHGSMCISYSGRCLLSNYMTGRHANLGDCAQPCRWNYRTARATNENFQVLNNKSKFKNYQIDPKLKFQKTKFFLEEKMRQGEFFEIEETRNGSNIMSSKDLCTIEFIDKMVEAGITGFKVEGRNKTEYYLAATALAYREAIDMSIAGKYSLKDKKRLKKELLKVAHRDYTSGFLFESAKKGETYKNRSPIQEWEYIALITKKIRRKNYNLYKIIVKNKVATNQNVEVLNTVGIKKDKILKIVVDGNAVNEINPGKENQGATIMLKGDYSENSTIRAKIKSVPG